MEGRKKTLKIKSYTVIKKMVVWPQYENFQIVHEMCWLLEGDYGVKKVL